jgi:ankyrin repeat protein
MAELLLAAGATVYDAKNNDWPALVHASMQGHTDVVRLLLTQVDRVEGKNAALCFAARHGHLATVTLLLDAGADMQAKGRLGKTPLQEACDTGQPRVIQLLLERKDIPVLDNCGNALITAAREGGLDSLRLLLKKGVDINYQGYAKWSALMSAALAGSADSAAFLLDNGADPNIRDAQGKTALRLAIESKHDRMKELLLQRGARE